MGNTFSCCLCPHGCPRRGQRLGSKQPHYESEVYEVVAGNTEARNTVTRNTEAIEGDQGKRGRSNSYLLAIQAGCSEDGISLQFLSPPPSPRSLSASHTLPRSPGIVESEETLPPVSPCATSEPFVSVMLQRRTESAQDTHLDSQGHQSEVTSQLGRNNFSNCMESSTRPPSVPEGSVTSASKAPEPPSMHAALTREKGTQTSAECHLDVVPKREMSSIGIQVGCTQPVPEEKPKTQSIGVQVEDDWGSSDPCHSVSSQQDTYSNGKDVNPFNSVTSEGSLKDGTPPPTTVSTDAGSLQAPNSDPEASCLPACDPGLEPSCSSQAEPAQPEACRPDGRWFLKLLQAEAERLEGWCCLMDKEATEQPLPEDVHGNVLSAVGSARLLMAQKFQQFRGLCELNLNPQAKPRPTDQDLAGFWDLLQLPIEDIRGKFEELHRIKANGWQPVETPEKRQARNPCPAATKKPAKSRPAVSRHQASDAGLRQRQEARKRLLEAKRAAARRPSVAPKTPSSPAL